MNRQEAQDLDNHIVGDPGDLETYESLGDDEYTAEQEMADDAARYESRYGE